MKSWIEELRRQMPELTIRENVLLKNYTSFRIGGPAECFIEPSREEEILNIQKWAETYRIPFFLMGNGSNLLVRDGGLPGITVRLGSRYSAIQQTDDTSFTVFAGALMSEVSRKAAINGLSGMEFASGIPGTIGGGLYMNAGAYGGEMSQIVTGADCFENQRQIHLDLSDCQLSYRHSVFMEKDSLITKVYIRLQPGERDEIQKTVEDLQRRRKEKQPLAQPSAGSFFKRPQGDYAARLIEGAGMKGYRKGNAAVSDKHSGFVVNLGGASAQDVLALMEDVQKAVWNAYHIQLEPEVKIIGAD